jgi:hypothetical protein
VAIWGAPAGSRIIGVAFDGANIWAAGYNTNALSRYRFSKKDSSQKTTIPWRAKNRIAEKSKIEIDRQNSANPNIVVTSPRDIGLSRAV